MSKYRFLLINAFSLAPGSSFQLRSFAGPKETQIYNYEDLKPFLDDIESTAQQIGAVNTILAIDGKLIGYNTDATGALRALREGGAPLKNETVAMLGSGGAARAIAFALAVESGISCLILLGIEEKERTALAADLRTKTTMNVVDSYLDEATLKAVLPQARVLIHCTPIGMAPKVGKSCVPAVLLHRRLTVMDIVYNPRNTQLLLDARRRD